MIILPHPRSTLRDKQRCGKLLRSWNGAIESGDSMMPEHLVYQLEHQYTNANLKLRSLKGLDMIRAEHVRELSTAANVCFYLASMEHEKSGEVKDGGYDHYSRHDYGSSGGCHIIEECLEEKISLKRLVDVEGHLLAQDIALDEDAIIQEDPFDREPDKEDYEGYTGNAGASATQWYHDTVR